MEVLVDQHLPSVIKGYSHIKDCEICQNDIKSLALNNLKPHYVNSQRGLIFAKLNDLGYQFNTDIIRELVQAAEKVKNCPRCQE